MNWSKHTSRTKGKKLFRCADCKHEWFEHPLRLERAARVRCTACGSISVDISKQGSEELVRRGDVTKDTWREDSGGMRHL